MRSFASIQTGNDSGAARTPARRFACPGAMIVIEYRVT